ncbi:MAG: STAS domain-containing protein, partial [Betaproteobacteria bacterium]
HGGTLYLCNLKPVVIDVLDRGGFLDRIDRRNVFATKADAIAAIYRRLDANICRACEVRIFTECQRILPDGSLREETT